MEKAGECLPATDLGTIKVTSPVPYWGDIYVHNVEAQVSYTSYLPK